MKIVLEAFGKLRSEPMDVPENTSPVFRLVLNQPIQVKTGYSGDKIGEWGSINTMCEFEWTGKLYSYSGGESARIYVLRDIGKI